MTDRGSQVVLALVADKWTPVVLDALSGQTLRFGELRRETGAVSHKVLAATLRAMERNGLVTRTSHGEVPPRVEYALTAIGQALVESLEGLARWGAAHGDDVAAARERWDRDDPVATGTSSRT